MELKTNKATPFQVTKDALNRLSLLKEYEKGKYFRVYVTGGGCSGFQCGFKFDEFDRDEDSLLDFDGGVSIILDQLSYPYLLGSFLMLITFFFVLTNSRHQWIKAKNYRNDYQSYSEETSDLP